MVFKNFIIELTGDKYFSCDCLGVRTRVIRVPIVTSLPPQLGDEIRSGKEKEKRITEIT